MKELLELVETIEKNSLVNVDFINDAENGGKSGLLYEGLKSGKVKDDLSARRYVYGDSPESEMTFKKLKSRLKDKLFNSILLLRLDGDSFSKGKQINIEGQKMIAAAEVLMSIFNYHSASELAKRVLKSAERFETTDQIIRASKILTKVAALKGQKKDFLYYSKLQEETEYANLAFSKVKNFFQRILLESNLSRNINESFIEEARLFCKQIDEDFEKVNNFDFRYYCFLIKISYFHIKYDYQGLIKEGETALAYIKKEYPLKKEIQFQAIHFQMISAYLQLNYLEKAKTLIDRTLFYTIKGTAIWFLTEQLNFIYLFRSQKYQTAFNLFDEVSSNKRFSAQYDRNFLAQVELVDASAVKPSKRKRKFRLGRFLNEMPLFSKDKKGMNVAIIIIQILFLLAKNDFSEVIERVESIKQYGLRHLRKNSSTYRSDCFIKMLLLLPTAEFHQERVAHRSKSLLAKLSQSPINGTEQSTEVEIVPYEHLWQMILDQLPGKVIKATKKIAS